MFESLTQRLSGTIERLRGRGRLTEENIREATREVRIALLEADVALPVVQALVERIKVRAVGQEVIRSLTPGQALIKVVRDELTAVMGAVAGLAGVGDLDVTTNGGRTGRFGRLLGLFVALIGAQAVGFGLAGLTIVRQAGIGAPGSRHACNQISRKQVVRKRLNLFFRSCF